MAVIRVTLVVALAVFSVAAAARRGQDAQVPVLDIWVFNSVYLLAAVACLVHRSHRPRVRQAWRAMAAALLLSAVGNVYYSVALASLEQPPYPSLADAVYLAWYPLIYISVLLLLRDRVRGRGFLAGMWLDGLVTALGAAALMIGFLLHPVLSMTGASTAEIVVNLAYPVADVLLLVLLVGCAAALGARLDRALIILGAGLAITGLADALFLIQDAAGSYHEGGGVDLAYLVGVVLMAVSAAERDPIAAPAGHRSDRFAVGHLAHARRKDLRRPPDHARVGWRVLALPGTATIVSAVVLGARADLPSSARWAAAACILVALTRVMITFAEVRDLGDVYRQSRTDELTGLPNRRALVERCEELAGPTGLLLLDLDRFKEVNDSLGHGTGDALLVRVGTALRGAVHAHDLLARLGGDEFAVLVPDASPEVLAQVAADLDRALDRPFALDHVVVRVTPSIGSAIVPDGAAGRGELLRRADVAMYQAKSTQAGTVAYADVDTTRSVDGLQAVAELRRVLTGDGLPAGSLVVEFQPQILLATGAVSAVEALVRWDHPSRGRLLPEGFLDAAETAGLLSPLTDIVMDGALRACRRWWALGDRVPVTVNLSAGNASDRSLPSKIADSLARHQLPGRALVVELTEGMLLVNPVRARSILGDIRALGVAVSIDDYGTGQSSLSYLRTLPVDELKIDRVFTHDLAADPAAATIVRHTIDLARALGLRSVAEGVEDHVTLQVLSGFGCDAAQGFHVAAPMPAADLMDWLDNHGSMAVSTPRALH